MKNPPIKSGSELDWAMVAKAAKAILKQAEDADFVPPEALDIHMMKVGVVCKAMSAIQDGLKLRRKDPHELTNTEDCSLFDSEHAYADGMCRITCSCSWVSEPIPRRDKASYFQTHVLQQVGKNP